MRRKILSRDGWKCVFCGGRLHLECDHIHPVSQGGAKFDPANLRTLCRRCHIQVTAEARSAPEAAAIEGREEWLDFVRAWPY